MKLEVAKGMDRRCVLNWLNEVYVTPSRAFNEYTEDELKMFAHDALILLKEQEPRVMTLLEIEQSENRLVWFEDDQFNNYALVDGIDQRNGWVWLSHMGLQQRRDYENYGKRWRCWTKRPAEDQRKEVKWENADGNH